MTDQFYTPYERQNHADIVIDLDDLKTRFRKNLFAMKHRRKLKKLSQTLVRRYVINADYEYKPELKEVRNEQDRPTHS